MTVTRKSWDLPENYPGGQGGPAPDSDGRASWKQTILGNKHISPDLWRLPITQCKYSHRGRIRAARVMSLMQRWEEVCTVGSVIGCELLWT